MDRKAAQAAYQERKAESGICAVRCAPCERVWVGAAPNLGMIQSRIWFSLRHGGSSFPSPQMHAAGNEHGADASTFEELERLDEEYLAYRQADLLKVRAAHWRQSLNADSIEESNGLHPCQVASSSRLQRQAADV